MNNSDTTQSEQLNEAAVKCRFFAQYWGTKTMYVGGVGLVEIGKGGWNFLTLQKNIHLFLLVAIS